MVLGSVFRLPYRAVGVLMKGGRSLLSGRPGVSVASGCLLALVLLAGCGGGSGSEDAAEAGRLRAENGELRAENEDLQAEVGDLQAEIEDLQAEVGELQAEAETDGSEAIQEESAPEGPVAEASSEPGSDAGGVEVAGPGDVSGEPVPGIKPEDLPLPAGAVIDYADEGDYNFTLDFVLDSDLASVVGFYEERLQQAGWEEVDRTEYEQDGLEGVEVSYERGAYVPQGSPQNDPDYEQTDQTLNLILQEIQPSGVGSRISWNSYELLDETS